MWLHGMWLHDMWLHTCAGFLNNFMVLPDVHGCVNMKFPYGWVMCLCFKLWHIQINIYIYMQFDDVREIYLALRSQAAERAGA